MTMTSRLSENSSKSFDLAVFLLPSIVTGPSFMSISSLELQKFLLIKDWLLDWRNLEIVNTPVCVLPSILRLGQIIDTKFGPNVSNKMLLNAPKCQGYGFYRFWVIKGKPRGKVRLLTPLRLVLNNGCWL